MHVPHFQPPQGQNPRAGPTATPRQLPPRARQLRPGPPRPPHALPSAFRRRGRRHLLPPPQRLPPRPPHRPRAQPAPEPARSRLCPAGSPPRPARTLPAARRFHGDTGAGRPRPPRLPWWAPHRQVEKPGPAAPWPGGGPRGGDGRGSGVPGSRGLSWRRRSRLSRRRRRPGRNR